MARSSPQSVLRFPLTTILGAEANVRVLRELVRHGGELSAPALAGRSGLAASSVRQALALLEAMGVVTAVGSGRNRLFRAARSHPLAVSLAALFRSEEERFDGILAAIRAAAERCGPGLVAVWLYGSVARGEDSADSDVDIAVVAEVRKRPQIDAHMRDLLRADEARLVFSASIVTVDTGDILRHGQQDDPWWKGLVADAIAIMGERPEVLLDRLRRRRETAVSSRIRYALKASLRRAS